MLTVVGVVLPGTPLKADDSTAKMVGFFADHRDDILAASFVLGLAAVFFFWFLGSFRSYLRAAEGGEGRLSVAAFGGDVDNFEYPSPRSAGGSRASRCSSPGSGSSTGRPSRSPDPEQTPT